MAVTKKLQIILQLIIRLNIHIFLILVSSSFGCLGINIQTSNLQFSVTSHFNNGLDDKQVNDSFIYFYSSSQITVQAPKKEIKNFDITHRFLSNFSERTMHTLKSKSVSLSTAHTIYVFIFKPS